MPKPTESAPLIGPDGELLTPIPVPKSSLLRYLRLPLLIVTTTALTLIGLGCGGYITDLPVLVRSSCMTF
jgi:hypothetical protein